MGSPWQHRMTIALDGGHCINRVRAVFQSWRPQQLGSVFKEVAVGVGVVRNNQTGWKRSRLIPSYAAAGTRSSGKTSYFKGEKCISLLDDKLDLLFISLSPTSPGTS